MNYRHAFHAGNFADVLKHLVLTLVVAYLAKKAAPFRIIDTHAGAGLYDLASEEAQKTGEWRAGIGRLVALRDAVPEPAAKVLAPYLDLLESDFAEDATDGRRLVRYPGSPLIARRLMREGDQLVANELHPEDRERLAELFHRDSQAKVMGLDGYTALKALLPPKERRGLVLVDPPFEAAGEFDRLAGAVAAAHRRFATGILMLWFPIKVRADVDRLYARLAEAGLAKALAAELQVAAPVPGAKGLVATGVVIVNPPFTLAGDLAAVLPFLAEAMATGPGAQAHWRWIVQENAQRSRDQSENA
ncbi:MAG: 23S rRNA (adenine(2030)-N(6))-methyltransferase RlmJ [Hyphomicrobiaceae bacterium]|nr:23S rRNA (adenine(2030)-N(6))-methyltransferase RlmJ [Hyphomicrobiaceae bacterium]MCC0007088.1 23S rRNA (adenine(2030)-N(6))-methyltransferase RlmJ [Hyphomicrobiaceae bacterium]